MRGLGRLGKPGVGPEILPGLVLATATLFAVACSSGAAQPDAGAAAPTGSSSGTGSSGTPAQTGSTSGSSSGSSGPVGASSSGTGGASSSGSGGSGGSGLDASGGSDTTSPGTEGGTGSSGGQGGSSGTAGADSGGSSGAGTEAGGSGGAPGFVDLFNGTDLTGFVAYQQTTRTGPGLLLTGAAALALFKPENGTIHVYGDLPDQSTQPLGMLETIGSYTKYNLSWDYQWGTKKFAPYTDLVKYPRDAGLMWHIHGDKTQVWPSSIEFQNKWGTTGDIFALYAQCTSLGTAGMPTVFADTAAGGVSVLVNGATGYTQHMRSADFETPGTGPNAATGVGSAWNSCLLQVDGGTAVYTVNGHIVNQVLKVMDKNGNPVTSGPVAWQAESAEAFYRNLRIQVLP